MSEFISEATLLESPCLGDGEGTGFLPPEIPSAPTLTKQCEPPVVIVTSPAFPDGALSIEIERSANGGLDWQSVHSFSEAEDWGDVGVLPIIAYKYRARACNDVGCSAWSTPASISLISETLTITIIEPLANAGKSGVVLIRFSALDLGVAGTCLANPQVFIGRMPTGLTPKIESPDICAESDLESRNTVYALRLDTRNYANGIRDIRVVMAGSDCCLAEAVVAINIVNNAAMAVAYKDFVYNESPSDGLSFNSAMVSFENRELSVNPSRRYYLQMGVRRKPVGTYTETDFLNHQQIVFKRGASQGSESVLPRTQYFRNVILKSKPEDVRDYIALRAKFTPIEYLSCWETGYNPGSIKKIRFVSEGRYNIFAARDDRAQSGLFSFINGVLTKETELSDYGITDAKDLAVSGNDIYVMRDSGVTVIDTAPDGDLALNLVPLSEGVPESRLPVRAETIGSDTYLFYSDNSQTPNTICYKRNAGGTRKLWEIDEVVQDTFVFSGSIIIAAQSKVYEGRDGVISEVNDFGNQVTALHSIYVGLQNGNIMRLSDDINDSGDWVVETSLDGPVTAIGDGRIGMEFIRGFAGGNDDMLIAQTQDVSSWVNDRQMIPPSEVDGVVTNISALMLYSNLIKAAVGVLGVGGTAAVYDEALLIGTQGSGLLFVLQKTNLDESKGVILTSGISYPDIDLYETSQ